MIIVYASRTGNVKRFVSNIRRYQCIDINQYDQSLGAYVLITYTTGFGEVPEEVGGFLAEHGDHMVAVVASGNRNWGQAFGRSADTISQKFNVPVLHKFELSGTRRDVDIIEEGVERVECEIYRTK